MEQWVPFGEGEYIVERAFLTSPEGTAVGVENAVIEVFTDAKGVRGVRGTGMVRPFHMVELHEETDDIDLYIDLGHDFKYRMAKPVLQAGKVFSPEVQSLMQFYPRSPWEPVSVDAFADRVSELDFLDG